MRHKLIIISLLLTLLSPWLEVRAQEEYPPLKISLLTCSPSKEVYGLFGHTAIRVQDMERNLDLIFNYGMFSFNTPNFIYRFVKGETDYWVGAVNYQDFALEYGMRGIGVQAQDLNLTPEEAQQLYRSLIVNCQPENRIYRYNFLTDNCTTRAYHIIEGNIAGKIRFEKTYNEITYREMIELKVKNEPWVNTGINILLGAPLDEPLEFDQSLFLPSSLQDAFDHATIVNYRKKRPLVSESYPLLPRMNEEELTQITPWYATPMCAGVVLLLVCSICSIYQIWRGCNMRLLDTILFAIYGLVGLLLFFLMFVSTHPATYPNYSAIWLNPFLLFIPIAIWIKPLHKVVHCFFIVNTLLLLGFIMCWNIIPQIFPPVFMILVIIILLRSFSNILVPIQYKSQKRRR